MPVFIACSVYLAASIAATLWAGRTLHRSGQVFLAQSFPGNTGLANSVNRLVAGGFYLVSLGWIAQELAGAGTVTDAWLAVQFICGKLGGAFLLLGCLHFGSLFLLNRLFRPSRNSHPAAVAFDAWVPADRPLGKVLE